MATPKKAVNFNPNAPGGGFDGTLNTQAQTLLAADTEADAREAIGVTAAGDDIATAANVAAQQSTLQIVPSTGGTFTGPIGVADPVSGGQAVSRDFADDRYSPFFTTERHFRWQTYLNWGTAISSGFVDAGDRITRVRASGATGNRAALFMPGGNITLDGSRGIPWDKASKGRIIFKLNGDSRGTVRAFFGGPGSGYTSGQPTVAAIGFYITGAALTPFVHDGTTETTFATSVIPLSGNNWVNANTFRFDYISDGAGNVTFFLNGTQTDTGTGAPSSSAAQASESVIFSAESSATTTSVTDIYPLITEVFFEP